MGAVKRPPTSGRWRGIGGHVLLWAAGAIYWLAFIAWGRVPFWFLDWRPELSYLAPLKEALVRGLLPLHVSNGFNDTDRLLAVPVTMLAPHVIALRWLSFEAFEVLHVLVCFTVGYLGAVALKRRLKLSGPAFVLFLLLFVLNGFPSAHLAVGHMLWWAGYQLAPWFLVGVLAWIEDGPSVRLSLGLAVLIFSASLVGAFHYCNWFVLFLGLLGLTRPRWLLFAGLTGVVAAALSAYRMIPAVFTFPRNPYDLPGGFPDAATLVAGFTAARSPAFAGESLGWWEYDFYTGWLGLGILLALGVLPLVLGEGQSRGARARRVLLVPIGGLVVLACGDVFRWVFGAIPPFSAERVTTRFLVLPVVALSALAAAHLDLFRPARRRGWIRAALLAGTVFLAVDLGRQAWGWRVAEASRLVPRSMSPPVAVSALIVKSDPAYVRAVAIGWAVSALALAGTAWWVWKLKPTRRSR